MQHVLNLHKQNGLLAKEILRDEKSVLSFEEADSEQIKPLQKT
ncbi:hypothetical protein [Priestia megaterium]|nr:hypothetical protein [Priestia megaterium]